jgi:hypothetical protein
MIMQINAAEPTPMLARAPLDKPLPPSELLLSVDARAELVVARVALVVARVALVVARVELVVITAAPLVAVTIYVEVTNIEYVSVDEMVVVLVTVTIEVMVIVSARLTIKPILSSFCESTSKLGDERSVTIGCLACVLTLVEYAIEF